MSDAAEEKKEGAEAPKKSNKKMIIIIAAAVLVLGGAGAFFAMGSAPKEGEEEEIVEEEIHEGHHTEALELGTFLVNLSENATFLKATIVIEVNSDLLHEGHGAAGDEGGGGHGGGEATSKLPGALGAKEAHIKDRIIKILSSKRAQQLLDAEGKVELSEEIADAVNQIVELDEELVSNVFFTTFIIQ